MRTMLIEETQRGGFALNLNEREIVELTDDQLDRVDGALGPVAVGAVVGAFGGALGYGLGAGQNATFGGYVAAGVYGFIGGALGGVGGLTAGLGGTAIGALGGWGATFPVRAK